MFMRIQETIQTHVYSSKHTLMRKMWNQRELVLLTLPFILFFITFNYLPLLGWVMAFQDFRPKATTKGTIDLSAFFNQKWVGLDNFKYLFSSEQFARIMRNTFAMSVMNLIVSTFLSVFLAVLINEMRSRWFKKTVQTISYLPHFLSWIIACSLISNILSLDGAINRLLSTLGIIDSPVLWLGQPKLFWILNTMIHAWKGTGWNSIMYLAAISAIDPGIYEAAQIDGAGRWQRVKYITLPGIRQTILMLLIMNIGSLMNQGFDVQYLLGNGLTTAYSETIDIYVLKYGVGIGNYSLATATGIFKSVLCIVLLFSANKVSDKLFGERLI